MTQSAIYGEIWSHVRDNAKGCNSNEANDLHHICKIEYLHASKAHLKRLARVRAAVIDKRFSAKPVPDAARLAYNERDSRLVEVVRHFKPFYRRPVGERTPNPERAPAFKPEHIIAGLLPDLRTDKTTPCEVVQRLEPDYRVAKRLIEACAIMYGPLTRQQQAEYAFTVAQYGDIIYA